MPQSDVEKGEGAMDTLHSPSREQLSRVSASFFRGSYRTYSPISSQTNQGHSIPAPCSSSKAWHLHLGSHPQQGWWPDHLDCIRNKDPKHIHRYSHEKEQHQWDYLPLDGLLKRNRTNGSDLSFQSLQNMMSKFKKWLADQCSPICFPKAEVHMEHYPYPVNAPWKYYRDYNLYI